MLSTLKDKALVNKFGAFGTKSAALRDSVAAQTEERKTPERAVNGQEIMSQAICLSVNDTAALTIESRSRGLDLGRHPKAEEKILSSVELSCGCECRRHSPWLVLLGWVGRATAEERNAC